MENVVVTGTSAAATTNTRCHSDNSIKGGSSKMNDENGYADLIYWTEDTVYIWEIKHKGGAAEALGQKQVNNYIKAYKHS